MKLQPKIAMGDMTSEEQTLDQLLVAMDGFDTRAGIIMGATNRSEPGPTRLSGTTRESAGSAGPIVPRSSRRVRMTG